MNRTLLSAIVLYFTFLVPLENVYAQGDYTKQEPDIIELFLGNKLNDLRFYPAHLNLITGKLYRLVLRNPSPQKHYFSSEGLSSSVFTRKVQVYDSKGNSLAEIKGFVREIEVYPGGVAEWWFVPIKTANIDDLKCVIKGHEKQGMVGNIIID